MFNIIFYKVSISNSLISHLNSVYILIIFIIKVSLKIKDYSFLGADSGRIHISDNVLIAQNVEVRAANHNHTSVVVLSETLSNIDLKSV